MSRAPTTAAPEEDHVHMLSTAIHESIIDFVYVIKCKTQNWLFKKKNYLFRAQKPTRAYTHILKGTICCVHNMHPHCLCKCCSCCRFGRTSASRVQASFRRRRCSCRAGAPLAECTHIWWRPVIGCLFHCTYPPRCSALY